VRELRDELVSDKYASQGKSKRKKREELVWTYGAGKVQ